MNLTGALSAKLQKTLHIWFNFQELLKMVAEGEHKAVGIPLNIKLSRLLMPNMVFLVNMFGLVKFDKICHFMQGSMWPL